MLIAIMLGAAFFYCYAECRYVQCRYAQCHYAECRHAEYCHSECRYAQRHYAECRGTQIRVVAKPYKRCLFVNIGLVVLIS
jgi:hypothetical protein